VIRWGAALIAAPFFLYGLAAALLGALPANGDRIEPASGVRIYVVSNGAHTDLMLPREAAGVDWRLEFPIGDFRAAAPDAPYIGFGWGDRDFYMATRSWADVSPGLVWRALTGDGPTALKVGNYLEPTPGDQIATQLVTEPEYHRLVAYIRRTLVRRGDGSPLLYPGSGYGDHDAFYAANGRYSALKTCNEWVAEGLREAGLKAPVWSPLAFPILWRLRDGR
jgi:uncharacterized protein (TIGR02117 family)